MPNPTQPVDLEGLAKRLEANAVALEAHGNAQLVTVYSPASLGHDFRQASTALLSCAQTEAELRHVKQFARDQEARALSAEARVEGLEKALREIRDAAVTSELVVGFDPMFANGMVSGLRMAQDIARSALSGMATPPGGGG